MRVTLIRYHDHGNVNTRLPASLNARQGALPPLGLGYIASSLREHRHEVQIIDAIVENLSREEVLGRIKAHCSELVGVTAMTPTFQGALEAAELGKQAGCKVVMGGVHMAIFARETLTYDCVDFGVVGEGEETMIALCAALEGDLPVDHIGGLAYRGSNGDVKINPGVLPKDLDLIPFPAFDLMPMEKYSSIIGLTPVSTIMGSRGCPYQCGFCYKTPSDKSYRRRSAKNIVDEIEHLIEQHKVKEVMFYDDLMPPKYIKELCNEIISRNVKIVWEVPQRVNLVDPDSLKLMHRAGCRMLRYGVEQGDPDMMQLVEKKTNIDQVRKVFKWTHDAGIDTFAYFIIGYIGETDKTMRATIDLAKELNPRYVMFTKATPLPATPLMASAIQQGYIDKRYWRDFVLGRRTDEIQPFVPDAAEWVKKAYREFYLRPSRIWKQLLYIRTWSDVRKSFSAFVGLILFRMTDKEDPSKIASQGYQPEHVNQNAN